MRTAWPRLYRTSTTASLPCAAGCAHYRLASVHALKTDFYLLPLLIASRAKRCRSRRRRCSEANSTQSPTFDGGVHPTIGEVQRHDDALDKLIAPDTTIQRLADGFDWAEGPVWVKDGGYLLFYSAQ